MVNTIKLRKGLHPLLKITLYEQSILEDKQSPRNPKLLNSLKKTLQLNSLHFTIVPIYARYDRFKDEQDV